MTSSAMPGKRQPAAEPVDEVIDHVRGPASGPTCTHTAIKLTASRPPSPPD
jgi:hypothetical protein